MKDHFKKALISHFWHLPFRCLWKASTTIFLWFNKRNQSITRKLRAGMLSSSSDETIRWHSIPYLIVPLLSKVHVGNKLPEGFLCWEYLCCFVGDACCLFAFQLFHFSQNRDKLLHHTIQLNPIQDIWIHIHERVVQLTFYLWIKVDRN